MNYATNYFYIFLLTISAFSLGYENYYYSAFVKGIIYSPSQQKQVPIKFILSASLKIFLLIKGILILSPLIFILIVLLLQLKISILWWMSLFVSFFNGLFFVSYLYPKIKRIIYWDIKNPVEKWDKLYLSFNQSSKNLLLISLFNFLLIFVSYLNELLHLI